MRSIKMSYLKLFMILVISLGLLSSCTPKKPETKIIYKTKVVYQQCPEIEIPEKPKKLDYSWFMVEYEKNRYMCLSLSDAQALAISWLQYKNYCETIVNNVKLHNKWIKSTNKK
jgi:hypothetical protein